MRPTPAVATFPHPLSRRAFLAALGLACTTRLRPLATRLTALAEELLWLLHWCSRSAGPSFAAG